MCSGTNDFALYKSFYFYWQLKALSQSKFKISVQIHLFLFGVVECTIIDAILTEWKHMIKNQVYKTHAADLASGSVVKLEEKYKLITELKCKNSTKTLSRPSLRDQQVKIHGKKKISIVLTMIPGNKFIH